MKILSAAPTSRMIRLLALVALLPAAALAADAHTSGAFKGAKANQGTVTHTVRGGQSVLTLSADFKVPDAPDPHWRLIDSQGTGYLLQRVVVKPDHVNQMIVVPPYVKDVAKVQIWCAFAETLLGEASFGSPIAMHHAPAAARTLVADEAAYDDSRMRLRDDAKLRGTSYEPLEYDDAKMRARDPKPNAPPPQAVKQVDYDESRMRPRE